jgi:hypothetical protein
MTQMSYLAANMKYYPTPHPTINYQLSIPPPTTPLPKNTLLLFVITTIIITTIINLIKVASLLIQFLIDSTINISTIKNPLFW